MKITLLLLIILVGLLTTSAAIWAYPSIAGPSGGAVLPSSATTPAGQFDVAVDFFNQKLAGVSTAVHNRLVYGLSPIAEIGVTFTRQESSGTQNYDQWGVNAKYVIPFALEGTELASGVIHNKYIKQSDKVTQVYVVGTKKLWSAFETIPSLSGKLGLNWTSWDIGGKKTEKLRAFAGLDYQFAKEFFLASEIQFRSGWDRKPLTSIYLRYVFDDALTGQIGLTNEDRHFTGCEEHDLFLGLNYRFLSITGR